MYLDIYFAIKLIRNVQHNKLPKEMVFSYIKRLSDKVVKDNFIEVKGHDY